MEVKFTFKSTEGSLLGSACSNVDELNHGLVKILKLNSDEVVSGRELFQKEFA